MKKSCCANCASGGGSCLTKSLTDQHDHSADELEMARHFDVFTPTPAKAVVWKKALQRKIVRRVVFQGIPISIEANAGQMLSWQDPVTKQTGQTKMSVPYGYIRRTEGLDGEEIDVFLGPNDDSDKVFIIDQMKRPGFSRLDEQKVMLGFVSVREAKATFLENYSDKRYFGDMKEMSLDEFKRMLADKAKKALDLDRMVDRLEERKPGARERMAARLESSATDDAEPIDENDDDHYVGSGRGVIFYREIEKAAALAQNPIGSPRKQEQTAGGKWEQDLDYSHMLPENLQQQGYTLSVNHTGLRGEKTGNINNEMMEAQLRHGQNLVGTVGGPVHHTQGVFDEGGSTVETHSGLDEAHRGKGLGKLMYEALFSHAYNVAGVRGVQGDAHSEAAHRVHQALAAKYGFNYRAPKLRTPKEWDIGIPGKEEGENVKLPYGEYGYSFGGSPQFGPRGGQYIETSGGKRRYVGKALLPNDIGPTVPGSEVPAPMMNPMAPMMGLNPMTGMPLGPPPIDVETLYGVQQLLGRIGSVPDPQLMEIASKIWGEACAFEGLKPEQARQEIIGFLLDQQDLLGVAPVEPSLMPSPSLPVKQPLGSTDYSLGSRTAPITAGGQPQGGSSPAAGFQDTPLMSWFEQSFLQSPPKAG